MVLLTTAHGLCFVENKEQEGSVGFLMLGFLERIKTPRFFADTNGRDGRDVEVVGRFLPSGLVSQSPVTSARQTVKSAIRSDPSTRTAQV